VVPRLPCPTGRRPLILWWDYPRFVRRRETWPIWVQRAKCRRCDVAHALIPAFALRRRVDPGDPVIGSVVMGMVDGCGP
jgi:hypothetical protein